MSFRDLAIPLLISSRYCIWLKNSDKLLLSKNISTKLSSPSLLRELRTIDKFSSAFFISLFFVSMSALVFFISNPVKLISISTPSTSNSNFLILLSNIAI